MDKAIAGFGEQDHIAMNIHLTDVRRNEIVASTTVEASPKDLGVGMNFLFGGLTKFIDGGAQMKTPMQKDIQVPEDSAVIKDCSENLQSAFLPFYKTPKNLCVFSVFIFIFLPQRSTEESEI